MRTKKTEPQEPPKKQRIAFYFDKARYTLRLRQYHALISLANDILRELKKRDITPTNSLLRGLIQVREEKGEMLVQSTQGEAIKPLNMYKLVIRTTEEGEKAWSDYVEANLNTQAKPMHGYLQKQYAKSFEELLQSCYNIRCKYTQSYRSAVFESVDIQSIEYDSEKDDVHLSADTIQRERESCVVYAESERAESVYKGLLDVVEKLNCITENLLHPTQILEVFDYNPNSGKIELTKDFDFNTL